MYDSWFRQCHDWPDSTRLLCKCKSGKAIIGKCRPECTLTTADVDILVAKILDINKNRDRNRMAKLTVYIPAALFVEENGDGLRYFFSQMQTLAQQGVITWATQKQVYEAYVAWNQ